tara:strand:+ start:19331 stop:20158 length:828 start_codon:yes stop_codon:yes gene_type:complete
MSYNYLKTIFNNILISYCDSNKNSVFKEACQYCLFGGKFLRPTIVLAIYNSKYDITHINDKIRKLSLSIELLHNASLIIDDLPCMDNDDFRRNKPSLHKKYCSKVSKLVSNTLILDSYQMIISFKNPALIKLFSDNCLNACIGQTADMDKDLFSETDLEMKINYKTSALFIIAFINGYFSTINDEIDESILKKYILLGAYFSNIFQIIDDFDDLEKDINNNKLINHVIYYGKEKAYEKYTINRELFINLLKELDIYTAYFKEILEILKNKIDNLI